MKKIFVLLIICLILIVGLMLVYLVSLEGFSTITPLHSGETFRLHSEELIPREDLSILLVGEKQLVLYYDYEGIINIYTKDGAFLYGIQIESLKNGTGDIAFYNDNLYIMARGGKIYIFDDKILISSFRSTDDAVSYSKAKSVFDGNPCNSIDGVEYHIIGNKIMKSTEGGPYQIVKRLPQKNTDIKYLAIFILLTIAGLMHFLKHNYL